METSPISRQTPQRSPRLLTVGFALLVCLMVILVGHAAWHISDLEDRMSEIIKIGNRKIQLATDLQEASYNRHNALVYQALARDAFERDENFQNYIKWGFEVGKARNELKTLPLDAFEKANLMQQDFLVTEIIVLQEEISDLAARSEMESGRSKLVNDLRPLNMEYTEIVEGLRRHERDHIRTSLENTRLATAQAITLHLTLGGILVVLGVFIAIMTNRMQSRHTRTIYEQMVSLEEAGTQLQHLAEHDPLTGLANRALFCQRLTKAMLHARQENFLLAVMYLDLDDFKQVNDQYGHNVGDALLQAVASRLRRVVRSSDTAARLGGDEFALILAGLKAPDDCDTLRDKIEREISQPLAMNDLTLTPKCSIGYTLYKQDDATLDDLLQAADTQMYEVKRQRKQGRSSAGRSPEKTPDHDG